MMAVHAPGWPAGTMAKACKETPNATNSMSNTHTGQARDMAGKEKN